MRVYISRTEDFFNLFVYIGVLAYTIYNLFLSNEKILRHANYNTTLFPSIAPGWPALGPTFDNSAFEFEALKAYFYRHFKWFIAHVITSEVVKKINMKLIPGTHFMVGVSYVLWTYDTNYLLMIFAQFFSFYALRYLRSKIAVWLVVLGWTIFINAIRRPDCEACDAALQVNELVIFMSWNTLRGMSFILDSYSVPKTEPIYGKTDFLRYCGYYFYFPTFVHGPPYVYERYVNYLTGNYCEESFVKRFTSLLLSLLRIAMWALLLNVTLHFLYVHYLEFDHQIILLLDRRALYGSAFLMFAFFQWYYLMSYGTGIVFLRFEGISPPLKPICPLRVHLFSNMWRYFDGGLYEFLIKYIYFELQTKTSTHLRKICASFATFLFIFAWHGLSLTVFKWSMLNFVSVSIEKYFRLFWHCDFYVTRIRPFLSVRNQKRLYGAVGCHLFILSAMANLYFFSGNKTGNYFMWVTYMSGWEHYVMLSFYCYFIFQALEWCFYAPKAEKRCEIEVSCAKDD